MKYYIYIIIFLAGLSFGRSIPYKEPTIKLPTEGERLTKLHYYMKDSSVRYSWVKYYCKHQKED